MFIVYILPQSYLPSCSQQIPFSACLCPIFGSGYLSSIGFPSAASGKLLPRSDHPCPRWRIPLLYRIWPIVGGGENLSSNGLALSLVVNIFSQSDIPYCSQWVPCGAAGEYLSSIGSSPLLTVNLFPQSDVPFSLVEICLRSGCLRRWR